MICHSHSLHASIALPLVGLKNPNLCLPCKSLLIEHTALEFSKSFLFFIFNWSVKIHLWVSFWSKFRRPVLYWLEPLIPNSDWRLNSLDSIFLKFNVKVMRLKEMITNLRSSCSGGQTNCLCWHYRKCEENSVENVNNIVRCNRVEIKQKFSAPKNMFLLCQTLNIGMCSMQEWLFQLDRSRWETVFLMFS